MKIGILTFHRSHNYGSMLQAYALQQVLIRAGYECETIDFSSPQQKIMYALPWEKGNWIKRILKRIYYAPRSKGFKKKFRLFEEFLCNYIKLSPTSYEKTSDLANLDYDVIITGSDQIWNLWCYDFDWAYFIDFPFSGKRIAYAVSMGPGKANEVEIIHKHSKHIKNLLQKFNHILVREKGTQRIVNEISGIKAKITLDPTFLLKSEEWTKIINNKPIIKGDYIFYYTPFYSEEGLKCAEYLSEQYKVPVIETLHQKANEYKCVFLKQDIGPLEFLNLIYHAKLVIGVSFHVIVFSLIFKVPFWTINGSHDNRISNLLRLVHMENRSICFEDIHILHKETYSQDFSLTDIYIEKERNNSILTLHNCINEKS